MDLGFPDGPIEADIGCGKGRFLLARARAHPEISFLGVDRLLRRLAKLNWRLRHEGLQNVRLLCTDALFAVESLLPPASLSACYVLFPDPWPKRRHHPRRLVHPPFLAAITRVLRPAGLFHLATDHEDYFRDIERMLSVDRRFERVFPFEPEPGEWSDFEVLARKAGMPIRRCSFRLRPPDVSAR